MLGSMVARIDGPSRTASPMQTSIHPIERRSATRSRVRYLRAYSPIPGTILNLSEWGMSLETVSELEPGAEYIFRIRVHSMLFSFAGKVMWSRHCSTLAHSTQGSVDLFCCGVAFQEPVAAETLEFLTRSD